MGQMDWLEVYRDQEAIIYTAYPLRGAGGVEPIKTYTGQEAELTLDRSPVQDSADNREVHADKGKLYTERPLPTSRIKPWNLLDDLWGNKSNHCSTVPSYHLATLKDKRLNEVSNQ